MSGVIGAYVQALAVDLSREDAQCIRDNPRACACSGPPESLLDIPGAPCRCLLLMMAVERVLQT